MNDLQKQLDLLTQYNYLSVKKDIEAHKELKRARNVIEEFVSKFDKPEMIAPELVEYLRKFK